jgi:hypothetical protein
MLLAMQQWSYAHEKTEGKIVEAADAWAQAHGKGQSMDFEKAVEIFVREKSALGIDAKRTYLAKLKFAVEVFKGRKINTISADELREYLAKRERARLACLLTWQRDTQG